MIYVGLNYFFLIEIGLCLKKNERRDLRSRRSGSGEESGYGSHHGSSSAEIDSSSRRFWDSSMDLHSISNRRYQDHVI